MIRPSRTITAVANAAAPAPAAAAAAANPTRTNILLARGVALAVAAALLASALFAVGCKNAGSSSGGSAGGVAGARGDSTNMGTLVKSGGAPMNFRLGSAGTLRVIDTTANDTVVVTAPVPAGANVNINDAKGVTINGTIVKPGPLPARHRYALWLDTRRQQ